MLLRVIIRYTWSQGLWERACWYSIMNEVKRGVDQGRQHCLLCFLLLGVHSRMRMLAYSRAIRQTSPGCMKALCLSLLTPE